MRKSLFILSILMIVMLSACKTEFEKIRSSNDPERMYTMANKYYDEGEYLNAQTLYEIVIPYYRGKAEAEELFYRFAYSHYNIGQYILASHYFTSFGKTYYNSDKKEEAEYMAAYAKYKLSPSPKLDQSNSQDAIEQFQIFINAHPTSERVAEANDLIDKLRTKLEIKAFEQGELYYKTGNFISSIQSFQNMLKDFPESKKAEEVRFLILKSSYELATNSVYEKKQERFEKVIQYQDQLMKKFPKSQYKKEAKSILKDAETELKKIKV